jgi:hypothetical protein
VHARKVVIHSKFSRSPVDHDLAIIFLKKKLNFNNNVQPIQLNTAGNIKESSMAVITGWGKLAVIDFSFTC